MSLRKFVAAAAALAAVATAGAQTAQPSSPAKKELAAKVVQLQQSGFENMARMLVEQPAAQMLQQAGIALQQRVPADKREAVAKDIQADARKYVDETVPLVRDRALKLAPTVVTPMLEEKFTEDELKQVIAWLESPVQRKFGQFVPDLQRAMTEKLVADARPTVEPRLKTLEASVAKRLGITAPAAASAPARQASPAATRK